MKVNKKTKETYLLLKFPPAIMLIPIKISETEAVIFYREGNVLCYLDPDKGVHRIGSLDHRVQMNQVQVRCNRLRPRKYHFFMVTVGNDMLFEFTLTLN